MSACVNVCLYKCLLKLHFVDGISGQFKKNSSLTEYSVNFPKLQFVNEISR